ncbi:hypothetical protein [uncultured Mitsuokella sp.]|uniref:hypothetical protein n=1 Tax=uncultured Mitsuokella sp. TaxID=453120 RepID=UPI00266F50EC|nr:hypothetical protein [uncultured Mitsuokella sp.]
MPLLLPTTTTFLPVDQNKTSPPRRVAPMRRFQRQRPQNLPTHGIKIDRSREQIIRREDRRPSVADTYGELIRAQSVKTARDTIKAKKHLYRFADTGAF